MSLESSYDRTEQKLCGSTLSVEVNHSPIAQDNDGRAQNPSTAIPASNQEKAIYQTFQDPITLNDAAKVAFNQYWISGEVADLDRAVECWCAVLKLTRTNSPDWPRYLSNLGIGLSARYTRTGKLADLETAICSFQQAVKATPTDSPDRADFADEDAVNLLPEKRTT